ncbi:BgTH12-01615 [Blumeria graminis f. sp. triticale]|uniref:BgtAc-30977 n=3 Tax=Blumeria graminis TaxID=34373 RepID=A0A9X9QBT3_BLUGR|nr:hypothetical protein BGT96224_Ac30977 [Blumeria graminis f. sp. tritici 96224]CAD6501363.1 BgTH12-01615 [Blumeria graminis f. sp. triticale]VDB83860.1 BgtAc-30977 [Blumeria graminis f. sp. tritici]
MNLLERLNQKMEILRLEQRYTRQRNRRTTFVSEAQYVNGEYIYSPTSPHGTKYTADIKKAKETDHQPGPSKVTGRLHKMGLDWGKKRGETSTTSSSTSLPRF